MAGYRDLEAALTDGVEVDQTEESKGLTSESPKEPQEESVPEQLVSEADVDNGEDDESTEPSPGNGVAPNQLETALRRLEPVLQAQGFSVSRGEAALVLELPAGRSHRSVYIHEEAAEGALELDFSGWRSLERFDGVWNQRTGTVEVALRGERFGMPASRMLNMLAGRSPSIGQERFDDAVELSADASDVRLRIAYASGTASVLLGSSRFRSMRPPLTLAIWPVRLATTAAADELVETITDALALQLGMRRGMLLTPRRLEDREVARTRHQRRGGALTFPSSRYPHAPVALYQAGRERTTSPLLRYWAFYQVLEYFFPKYTRTDALRQISRLVRSPTFDPHNDEDIIRVVSITELGGARFGEEEQLALCLRAVTTADEITAFIAECGIGERLANRKDPLSSRTVNVNASEDLTAQLARRIYDIRCRIVHSKNTSQREGGPGLLPGTSDEDLVRYELPLIDFLAEQALVASSDRLDMRAFEFTPES